MCVYTVVCVCGAVNVCELGVGVGFELKVAVVVVIGLCVLRVCSM